MGINAVIYPDYNNDVDLDGVRIPYFYLHGKLEDKVGYDCCNGNIYALQNALMIGITLVHIDEIGVGLMFSRSSSHSMEGLIVLIDDEIAIKQAIEYPNKGFKSIMEESEKQYLKKYHLQSYNLIFRS
jgi:hypothetical protein